MKMPLLLIVFGFIGVFSRYYLDMALPPASNGFPLSTFLINIFGSFLIGALYVVAQEKGLIASEIGTALAVGLLGGFTTFSAFSLQIVRLLEQGSLSTALLYAFLSPALGVLAAASGIFGARLLIR